MRNLPLSAVLAASLLTSGCSGSGSTTNSTSDTTATPAAATSAAATAAAAGSAADPYTGLPLYPGVKLEDKQVDYIYSTADPLDKVVAFYKTALPDYTFVPSPPGPNPYAGFTKLDGGKVKSVQITTYNGKTLLHFGKSK